MRRGPLVSVVMVVRNEARFLPAAVDSVLGQTLQDLELLVVDDASTDEGPDWLAARDDPRLRVLRQASQAGPFASANVGLAAARGAFIARQDGDDVSHPERLAQQVEAFSQRPALTLLGSACRRIDAAGALLGLQPVPQGVDVALRCALGPPLVHSSVMWRAEAGLRYDGAVRVGGDFELWSRALLQHEADNLEAPLVDYRVWDGSWSATHRAAQSAAHDAASWHFVRSRWPSLASFSAHQALRRWAARDDDAAPVPLEARALFDGLISLSGGSVATLRAQVGALGQPIPKAG